MIDTPPPLEPPPIPPDQTFGIPSAAVNTSELKLFGRTFNVHIHSKVFFITFVVFFLTMPIVTYFLSDGKTNFDTRSRAAEEKSVMPREQRTHTSTKDTFRNTGHCTNWAIADLAKQGVSKIVKINSNFTQMALVSEHSCATDRICNIEAMDAHPETNVLYAIPNSKKVLYTLNTNPDDGIPDGTLKFVATLTPAKWISGLSFRPRDNTLWAWAPHYGLYEIDMTTGNMNLILASTLDSVEGIAWDNSVHGDYLYISRTPQSAPVYAPHELHRYNPETKSLAYYGPLPEDTDSIDFATPEYANGNLIGEYETRGKANFYEYDVVNKRVIAEFPIETEYTTLRALGVCIP